MDEIHTSAVKILIRRFKIVKQKANINLAEEEAVAAAVKAAELAAVYAAKHFELVALCVAQQTPINSAAASICLGAFQPANQANSDAGNDATAAAKDAAAKALAVPNMPQTQQRRQANLKHAQDEVDAAADKAAQLATVSNAKTRELRLIHEAMELERRTEDCICWQTRQTEHDAHRASGAASRAARAALKDKAAKELIAAEHFAKNTTADNIAPEEEHTANAAQVATKQATTTAKADKVNAARTGEAAANADKLVGYQTAQAAAYQLAADAPFDWSITADKLLKAWPEDALYCWHQAMLNTTDAATWARFKNLTDRILKNFNSNS